MKKPIQEEKLYQLAHELYPDLDLRMEVMLDVHRSLMRLDHDGQISIIECLLMEFLCTPEVQKRLIKIAERDAARFVAGSKGDQ